MADHLTGRQMSMLQRLPILAGLAGSCLLTQAAMAQQIAIQQPVIQNFSVGTTVSVPDRGAAYLGGVGSARSGRITTGPLRSGTALGLERQSSSSSVHVYIHDFEAMDAELLASAPVVPHSRIEPRIAERLRDRSRSSNPTSTQFAVDDRRQDAERLAEQAEARGKMSVAKLHWQRAAKHGSTKATQRLAELTAKR